MDGELWTAKELEFLAKYMNPRYLLPTVLTEAMNEFEIEQVIILTDFLNDKFSQQLKAYIEGLEGAESGSIPARNGALPGETGIARPPHKHRFVYRHSVPSDDPEIIPEGSSPLDELLDNLLPSESFSRWVRYFTDKKFLQMNHIARRFRRGQDYTLGAPYDCDPRVELLLGITPTPGWGAEQFVERNSDILAHGRRPVEPRSPTSAEANSEDTFCGTDIYLYEEDEDDESEDGVPTTVEASRTGAGHRNKADTAVYQINTDDDDVAFAMPPAWNMMSLVVRDSGLLRFVKYVSKSAPGDKWDIIGTYTVPRDAE